MVCFHSCKKNFHKRFTCFFIKFCLDQEDVAMFLSPSIMDTLILILFFVIQLLTYLLQIVETKYGIGKLASILEQPNSEGQTLLHLAVLGSHLAITKDLLERGCDVNSTMDGEETALHIAAITGNKEIVDLLLKFQQDNNVDLQNEAGRTALHKAARFGKYNVVTLLLER